MANQADKLKGQIQKTNGNGAAPAAAPANPVKALYNTLEKMKPELERALPKHLNADRLVRIAFTTIRQNPKLLECTPESLLGATMQAAQVGLEPDALGSCYFVPYNNKKKIGNTEKWVKEVQFQIGYKGLIELVRRTGQVTSIVANEVYKNDHFEFEYGLDEKLVHRPSMSGDRGEIVCFYAYARFKDGAHAFAVMSVEDVNKVRDRFSKSKNNSTGEHFGPWKDHYESMGKKTVIKQLIKYMPISVEVQNDIVQDETVKSSIDADPVTIFDMQPGEYLETPTENEQLQPENIDAEKAEEKSE